VEESSLITWLPYADFVESVGALDTPEVNQLRYTAVKILDIIHQVHDRHQVWEKHPSVLMWKGHEVSLCEYGLIACEEMMSRRPHVTNETEHRLHTHMEWATDGRFSMEKPPWFGDTELHISHQSNLLRHNPEFYTFQVPMTLGYVWPVTDV
jgi:hypothetical protein